MGNEQLIDFMRDQCNVLRAEIELLRKQVANLEDNRDTWKALSEAWRWLVENKD